MTTHQLTEGHTSLDSDNTPEPAHQRHDQVLVNDPTDLFCGLTGDVTNRYYDATIGEWIYLVDLDNGETVEYPEDALDNNRPARHNTPPAV